MQGHIAVAGMEMVVVVVSGAVGAAVGVLLVNLVQEEMVGKLLAGQI